MASKTYHAAGRQCTYQSLAGYARATSQSATAGRVLRLPDPEVGSTPSTRHHRCTLCHRDCDTGVYLETHVERRHPEADVHRWVVAEDPERDLQFSRR